MNIDEQTGIDLMAGSPFWSPLCTIWKKSLRDIGLNLEIGQTHHLSQVLLCRVIGGNVNYTDEVTPDPEVSFSASRFRRASC